MTIPRRWAPMVLLTTLLAAGAIACDDSTLHNPRSFDGDRALRYAGTQVAFGPRVPGQPGHEAMAAWLDSLLRAKADTVHRQRWTHVTGEGDSLPLVNFLAQFNPSATRRILLLAHWDTRPMSDAAAPELQDVPVPGANDGASGVAVLLGVADALDSIPPSIGVDLLFVDGEDFGDFSARPQVDVMIGSRYYAANQLTPPPLFAVLFDMVGDRDLRIQREGNSLIGASEVVDLVWNAAANAGYSSVFVGHEGMSLTDDHVELQKGGIRAIDVVDFSYGPGNTWWHTPEDTMDKISAASLGIVGTVALEVIATVEAM
ncbi:MAG TPA: M28 family peptidase [Gemmatimonadales bacterium]|nr:M28 family peptidase [Gemmatimonadales bacterium]